MPRQPNQLNRRPYSKLPSALRKTELIRLCVEFGLPSDGSVVDLRDRTKIYLAQNRDNLFRNPRFRALFLRQWRRNNPSPTPPTSSHTLSSQLSNRTSSPAHSDSTWNGIDNLPPIHPHQLPDVIQPQQLGHTLGSRHSTPMPISEAGFFPPTTQINDTREFPSTPSFPLKVLLSDVIFLHRLYYLMPGI